MSRAFLEKLVFTHLVKKYSAAIELEGKGKKGKVIAGL
jgi:hypothetical protein